MIETIIAQIRKVLPGRSTMIALLGAFALGVLLSTGKLSCRKTPAEPTSPLTVQGLARLGKAYTLNLGKVYATAWESGATALESGKPVSAALDAVHEAWERDRAQLFNRFVSAEFDKFVPQGKADADITAAERAILARAWRSFAAGLRR